jgi:hypothetical protein
MKEVIEHCLKNSKLPGLLNKVEITKRDFDTDEENYCQIAIFVDEQATTENSAEWHNKAVDLWLYLYDKLPYDRFPISKSIYYKYINPSADDQSCP